LADHVASSALELVMHSRNFDNLMEHRGGGITRQTLLHTIQSSLADFKELGEQDVEEFSNFCFHAAANPHHKRYSEMAHLRRRMASHVGVSVSGISDTSDDRSDYIDKKSFMVTLSNRDVLTVEKLVRLFDQDRKRGILERVFLPRFIRHHVLKEIDEDFKDSIVAQEAETESDIMNQSEKVTTISMTSKSETQNESQSETQNETQHEIRERLCALERALCALERALAEYRREESNPAGTILSEIEQQSHKNADEVTDIRKQVEEIHADHRQQLQELRLFSQEIFSSVTRFLDSYAYNTASPPDAHSAACELQSTCQASPVQKKQVPMLPALEGGK